MLIKVPSSAQDFGATMMEDSFIPFKLSTLFPFINDEMDRYAIWVEEKEKEEYYI